MKHQLYLDARQHHDNYAFLNIYNLLYNYLYLQYIFLKNYHLQDFF